MLDNDHQYKGLITAEQVLKEIAGIFSLENPGGIIILEVNLNDYSMSEIARIIEANDTKILSSGVKIIPDSTKIEITLKLNVMNIEPVIQNFLCDTITTSFFILEIMKKNEEVLKERYELLMRYLNT